MTKQNEQLQPTETQEANPNWRSGIMPAQGLYRARTVTTRSDGPDIPKDSYTYGMWLQANSLQKVHIPRNTDAEGVGNYIKGIWTGLWSLVTGTPINYGTSGGGGDPPTSIQEAIKAREDVQEIMRRNDRPPTQH